MKKSVGVYSIAGLSKAKLIAESTIPSFKKVGGYQHPPMKTAAQLLARYGNPAINTKNFEAKWMVRHVLNTKIQKAIHCLPQTIYINKDIVIPLEQVLNYLIDNNLHKEIKTWDGCFVVRAQRGSTSISMHSFGIALDLNAAWNPLYGKVTWTTAFLNVWRNSGWICGADFHSRSDGMHFEYTSASDW